MARHVLPEDVPGFELRYTLPDSALAHRSRRAAQPRSPPPPPPRRARGGVERSLPERTVGPDVATVLAEGGMLTEAMLKRMPVPELRKALRALGQTDETLVDKSMTLSQTDRMLRCARPLANDVYR